LVVHYGKPAGASFPQTKITPRRRNSLLSATGPKESAQWMESVPDFDGLFERKSSEEVGALLDAYLLDENSAEDVSSERQQYGQPAPTPATTSVDDAFNELLG